MKIITLVKAGLMKLRSPAINGRSGLPMPPLLTASAAVQRPLMARALFSHTPFQDQLLDREILLQHLVVCCTHHQKLNSTSIYFDTENTKTSDKFIKITILTISSKVLIEMFNIRLCGRVTFFVASFN